MEKEEHGITSMVLGWVTLFNARCCSDVKNQLHRTVCLYTGLTSSSHLWRTQKSKYEEYFAQTHDELLYHHFGGDRSLQLSGHQRVPGFCRRPRTKAKHRLKKNRTFSNTSRSDRRLGTRFASLIRQTKIGRASYVGPFYLIGH